jgi:hypothetical protein
LADLAERHGRPEFDIQFDPSSWKRHGQESFAVNREATWRRPLETYSSAWLEGFPETHTLRAAVRSDDVLDQHLDAMVGTEFHRTRRALADVVVYRLLVPMILGTSTYDFDGKTFGELFSTIEPGLFADRVRWIDFVPINGLVLGSGVRMELPGGLVLREMTDAEIGVAIRVLAIPVDRHDSPTSITISRFNQVALVLEHDHPFVAERDMPDQPAVPVVAQVDRCAARLITALRVVCGGSVAATRLMRMLHPDELEWNGSGQAQLTRLGMVDPDRCVVLFADDIEAVLEVYRTLETPPTGALGVALRRLEFAGGRAESVDRLVDLIISGEALFIHHRGARRGRKSELVGHGSRELLGNDTVLGASPDEVENFMRAAYRRRNDEVHGDPSPEADLVNLRGERTTDIRAMVEDLDLVMRRACRLTLGATTPRRTTAPGTS